MVKFCIVKSEPKSLKKGEIVIKKPDFLEEIKQNATKAPKQKLTASNHLRYIADSIASKYFPDGMSGWSVKPHLFEGRQYSSDEDLSKIVVEMMDMCFPKIYEKYVEYRLNRLPPDTELIYFVEFANARNAALPLFEKGFIQVTQEKLNKQKE